MKSEYNPYKITRKVNKLRKKGYTLRKASKRISKKYNLRYWDVKIATILLTPSLYKMWNPTLRRRENADKRREEDIEERS